MYFHLVVLLVLSSLSNGQLSAPGDTGSYCRDMSALPEYPRTVKRLMDSWSYQQLLSAGGPWRTLDQDNDTLTWGAVTGETCREKVNVSEPQNLPQDNWVITQYINKSIPSQYNTNPTNIYINISYILDSSCANVPCQTNFQLLYHLANQSNDTKAVHTAGYTLLANVTSLDDTSLHMKTFSFVMDTWNNGLYAAIRDIGSNITIVRLFVYRLVGPEMQSELTLFPQTPAPTTECVNVTGTCVANANTTSGRPPVLTLDPTGSWTDSEDCLCIEGHQPVMIEGMKQCQACLPSTYKSTLSNSNCQPCPANSQSMEHGVSICGCNSGYYRAPIETAADSCTQPPSAPRLLTASNPTNISVQISWDPPTSDGERSDLFYNIFVFPSTDFSNVRKVNSQPLVNVTSYFITSLEPNTLYFVQVESGNGVSNQSSSSRRVTTNFYTTEGVASQVTGVRAISEMFVEWNVLMDNDRGPITRYQVQFTAGNNGGRLIDLDRNTAVYEVNVTADFPTLGQPVYVIVRGFTSIGPGQWSTPVLFAQVNPLMPSTVVLSSSTSKAVVYTAVTVTMTTSSTSSNTGTTTTTSSTTTSNGATPTTTVGATPTDSGGSRPYISIVAVLGGAVFIVILVSIGALVYYLFRKLRLKYSPPTQKGGDETDGRLGLVKYEVVPGRESEDEEGRVQLNPMAETS